MEESNYIGNWQLIQDDSTVQHRTRSFMGTLIYSAYREVVTRTYEIQTQNMNEMPAQPVNPGNLPTGPSSYHLWQCNNRSFGRGRGTPFGTYTETWEKTGNWVVEDI